MLTAFAATATEDVATGATVELTNLLELVITRIPLWIAAGIVIVLSVIAAKIARKIVENKFADRGIEEEHQEIQILGGRITYAGILIIGITVGLKIAGIDLTTIIAAGAFGIGFALKDMIMNFLAGVMILVGRHFSIGDFINVGGVTGKVVEIQSRVTVLQAVDGTKVIVPNAELFRNKVTSYTSNPFRRIEITTGVDYRSNLENALKVCMKAVKSTKGILLEPKPSILVTEFGDSEMVIKVRAWVESKSGWLKIKSELIKAIKHEFEEYDVAMAWPIVQVAYDKDQKAEEKILKEEIEKEEDEKPLQPTIQATQMATPEAIEIGDDEQPLKPLGEV